MKDNRWILPLATDAVIESFKNNPFKQMIINDEIFDKANKDKLLDSCELLFDKLLKHLIDGTVQLKTTPDINAKIPT